MKNTTLPAAMLTILLCSCQPELAEQTVPDGTLSSEFSAQTEMLDAQTRTSLDSNGSVVWSAGDQLAIFQGSSIADRYQVQDSDDGNTNATFSIVKESGSLDGDFTGGTEIPFDTNVAVYPYESDLACVPVTDADGSVASYMVKNVTIPSVQTYRENSFPEETFVMAAVTSDIQDHRLKFRNVCGALKLQLKGTAAVRKIELRGNCAEALSGDATLTLYPDGTVPTVTMADDASTAVILDCGEGVQLNEMTVTSFVITIPPTDFENGFTAIITDTDGGTARLETTKPNPVRRSYIHSMPELAVSSSVKEPYVEIGAISTLGVWARNFYGKQYYRTPRYLQVTDDMVGVDVMSDCDVRVCQYDESFSFLKIVDFTTIKAGTVKNFTLDSSCRYIRLVFRKNSSLEDFELPRVRVTNITDMEFPEIRSADSGYQKLLVHLGVGDEILPDYGIMVLPETYSNVGEPTRLIIFCHGAAVNYPTSVSRFVASDLDPEYWLKEGYAIMDIEGNPFDNTNEHFYIPQAIQSYQAAYEWIVNTYNIRKDGVFLGGRSMGGGMCFEILQSSIPVIAACPIVPACNQLWYWNYADATRKKFCSEKMGFTGTQPSWTSKKKLTDEEYDYLYDNFDRMLACSPFWRGIENLPDKDALFSVGRVSANTKYDEAETELYSTLSYKAKAPVKIFTCYEDTTVPYQRNALLMYNMIRNSGQVAELSLVHTDASTPHRYELQDSEAFISVTTSYGETMQAPWVYVDMLEFWRTYE